MKFSSCNKIVIFFAFPHLTDTFFFFWTGKNIGSLECLCLTKPIIGGLTAMEHGVKYPDYLQDLPINKGTVCVIKMSGIIL